MRSPFLALAASLTLLGWIIPTTAQAGLITIVTGAANSASRTATAVLSFDAPNGTSFMSINRAKGIGTLEAGTAGGKVFFSARGTPVAMDLGTGAGYVTSGNLPLGLSGPSVLSWDASGLAKHYPEAKGTIDSNAVLLDIHYVASESSIASRQLKIELFNSNGNPLGTDMVPLPDGGWWVLGLDPLENLTDSPTPEIPPGNSGNPDPTPSPTPNVPGVPEPGTITLGLTGISIALIRAYRRRQSK